MTSRVLRRILLVLGAVAVIAAIAFGPSVVANFTKKKSGQPALATVATNSFPVVAKASGTLFPQSYVYVNFATSGQLSEIDVKVGDSVTAGQQLARLDQSGQQAALAAAQAAQNSARAALANAYASGNSQTVAAARAQLANADAQAQKAQSDLNNTLLGAPEAATVLQINAQVGEAISAGTTRIPALNGSSSSIIDPNLASSATSAFIVLGSATNYQVSAAFSEADAAQLKLGQNGNIVFDGVPGLNLPGHVVAIADSASPVNGVPEYYAAIAAVGSDGRLRTGMTVNVSIDVAQANNVLTVPNQAIYSLGGQQYVDVWYKGGTVQTQVTTGLIGDKLTQVTSGLTQGEQVVLAAGQTLPSASASPG